MPDKKPPAADTTFDWQFYLRCYADLSAFRTEKQAAEHWQRYGRKEGRWPNEEVFYQKIGFTKSDLPGDFSPQGYLTLNEDVRQEIGDNPYGAIQHFLQYGRHEKREYNLDSPRGTLQQAHTSARGGDWLKAAAMYARALESGAETVFPVMEADGSLDRLSSTPDILSTLQHSLTEQPDNGWLAFLLAELLARRGNTTVAMPLYKRAIERLPKQTLVQQQARKALILQADWTAVATLQQSIDGYSASAPAPVASEPAPSPPTITPEGIEGALEGADTVVRGWAFAPDQPQEPVQLDVRIDGRLLGTVDANAVRMDRLRRGEKGAANAFRMPVPDALLDGCIHRVAVTLAGSRQHLAGSPKMVKLPKKQKNKTDAPGIDIFSALRIGGDLPEALEDARRHGKLALCAMWQPRPYLEEFQQYLFHHVRDLGYYVVLLNPVLTHAREFLENARDHVDLAICRDNLGYDFGSWITGIRLFEDVLPDLDELLLFNDSCYGPVFDLQPLHEQMDAGGSDFWGITDSWETAWHVQSYYLCLKKSVLGSAGFQKFCAGYSFPKDKSAVIATGEVALSQHLLAEGLKAAVWCPYEEVVEAWMSGLDEQLEHIGAFVENRFGLLENDGGQLKPRTGFADYARNYYLNVLSTVRQGKPVNITHFFWKTLLEQFSCPFIKRELLNLNPMNVPDINEVFPSLARVSDYDTTIIHRHKAVLPGALVPSLALPERLSATLHARTALQRSGARLVLSPENARIETIPMPRRKPSRRSSAKTPATPATEKAD